MRNEGHHNNWLVTATCDVKRLLCISLYDLAYAYLNCFKRLLLSVVCVCVCVCVCACVYVRPFGCMSMWTCGYM